MCYKVFLIYKCKLTYMFTVFFILSVSILLIGAYCLLFKYNKRKEDIIENESADDYLYAEKIFVRDPEVFKDKDQDGIDDIIDKNK